MIELRPDQMDAVHDLRAALKVHQSVLLHAQCGWGKTVMAAFMAAGSARRGRRVIFGVHRRELLRQTALTFDQFGIEYGYIAGKFQRDPFARVQIATRQTLARYPSLIKCDLFVPDEAHLWCSESGESIINVARSQGAHIVPLTATPQQGSGKGLSHIADTIVPGPSAAWLIERGHLARYRAFAPVSPDLSGIHSRGGEFITSEVDAKFGTPTVIGDRVSAYRKFAMGKRHIGYCYSRENGEQTAESFRRAGIPALFIDGETPDDERRDAIVKFADREVQVLLNCQLFREGFDLSAQVSRHVPIESVGLYTPTQSLPLAIQMSMRPMRPQPEPATLIDHVNLLAMHGFPDDDREWSLDGVVKNKRQGDQSQPTNRCEACFRTFPPFLICPNCKTPREVDGRYVKEVEGEIGEIDVEAMRRAQKDEVRRARDLPALVKIAKGRGYKAGWVKFTLEARGAVVTYDEISRAWAR